MLLTLVKVIRVAFYDLIDQSRRISHRLLAHILLGWLGPIHTYLGTVLRRYLYPLIFGEIGPRVRIGPLVEIMKPAGIFLESQVSLHTGVSLRSFGANSRIVLHKNVHLDTGVNIRTHHSGHIEIGQDAYVGPYTCLSGDSISIGKDCMVASHCGLYANNHIFSNTDMPIRVQGNSYQGIKVEDDCWIGTGARILDGVTIGKGSVVGAGSVVTKNIPPYSIAVGAPAKVIKQREPRQAFNSTDRLSSSIKA